MLQVPRERLKSFLSPGQRQTWQGHELLIFEVEPTETAVMVMGNGFPRRVGDSVVQESEEAINAIKLLGFFGLFAKDG